MKFRGETIIELTDVNTGKKEVHRDTNMFTNALKYIYSLCGNTYGVHQHCDYFFPPVKDLGTAHAALGGVLLFDETIDEDEETIFKPDGVDIVGHAGNVSTTSTVSTRGSLNETESSIDYEKGIYKWVWDFATDKGNGTIKSLSLTSGDYGYIGNSVEAYASNYYDTLNTRYLRTNGSGSNSAMYLPQYLQSITGYYGNYCEPRMCYTPDGTKIYLITNGLATTSGTTQISIVILASNLAGISSLAPKYNSVYASYDNYTKIGDITLTVSESFCTGYNLVMNADSDDEYFYIITMNSSEFHILKVSFDDLSTTEYTVPFALETEYTLHNSYTKYDRNKLVWNGYLYARCTSTYGYRIDKYNIETGELIASSPEAESPHTTYIELHIFNGKVGYIRSTALYFSVWDETLNKWFFHAHDRDDYSCGAITPIPTNRGKLLHSYSTNQSTLSTSSTTSSYYSYSYHYYTLSTAYLATINNLSSAVTKVATQTMKVTYIVYEER